MRSMKEEEKMVYTSSEAQRDDFKEIFDKVYFYGKRIVIKRHNKEKVAMMPMKDYFRVKKLDEKKKLAEVVDESEGKKGPAVRAGGRLIGTSSMKKEVTAKTAKGKTKKPRTEFVMMPGSRKEK